VLSPDKLDKVKLWSSNESLFEYFKIENDYARSLQRQVPLPRGGNLVIEQTEALVSIDVNTGPKVHGKDQGKIILETNIDACYEIAKQLRLRDVGGLIIIDFIRRRQRKGLPGIPQGNPPRQGPDQPRSHQPVWPYGSHP
jgi:ribonuclease G